MDKHQETVIDPIFLRCVLSSDGQAQVDSDEPHFFFYDVLLSSDGQAPGDRDEPHFFMMCYCHLMDKDQATGMNPIFFKMCTVI